MLEEKKDVWLLETRTTSLAMRIGRPLVFLLGMAFCVLSWWLTGWFVFGVRNASHDVSRLEKTFPVVQSLRVATFRDQDWCRNLDYSKGKYSNVLEEFNTCNLFPGKAQAFDDQASEDFSRVRQALSSSGVPIRSINANYRETGELQSAEFHIDCLWCRRWYIYNPAYGVLPKPPSADTKYTRINDNWYLADEDWN
jgi:rubredoxin